MSDGKLVRAAAGLFMAAGLLTFLTGWVPSGGIRSPDTVDGVGLAAVLSGGLVWLLPWERWPPRRGLLIVPAALSLVAVADAGATRSPFTYGTYFVIVLAWVGLSQPPRTSLWVAPLAVPFYLVPAVLRHALDGPAVVSAIVTLCAGALIGETVGWAMAQARTSAADADHRARLLHAVLDVSCSAHSLEPAHLLSELTRGSLALGLDWVGMAVVSADGRSWKLLATAGDVPSAVTGTHPVRSGVAGLVLTRGHGVLLGPRPGPFTREAQTAADEGELHRLGMLSVAAAPVLVEGTRQGVLMGGCRRRQLEAVDLEALTLIADHAGRSFEHAGRFGAERRARRRLADMSVRDELTGVGNRRHATALLRSLIPGDAVVMIDLDHFKQVNDRSGHQVGDEVLRSLGEFLSAGLRDVDQVARYGGEEFVILLRQIGPDALTTVERLRSGWAEGGPLTTFSAGMAIHGPDDDPASTLARADAALYDAKRSGRNRTCVDASVVTGGTLTA